MALRIFFFLTISLFAAEAALAESITLNLGEGGGMFSKLIQLIITIAVLSLAPALVVMTTSFTRLIIVMSFLRTALGTQQSPPNVVLTSLALFMTIFIMSPTFEAVYNQGLEPLMSNKISESEAFTKSSEPIRAFMLKNVRDKDLQLFLSQSKTKVEKPEDTPLQILIPAFMISEIKRAFEIGFLIFLPFLVIDMVVASTLMAMGMMMLPPIMISLPFKVIFFVLVDGWNLLCGSLINSFKV